MGRPVSTACEVVAEFGGELSAPKTLEGKGVIVTSPIVSSVGF